jgi:hypothetical protein
MEKVPFAGQLDRVITIYRSETIVNAVSEHKVTLIQVAKPRAMLKDLTGSQVIEGAVLNEVNRSYTIRRYSDIAKNGRNMIVQDGDVKYNVYALKEIERTHLELFVTAYE